MKEEKGRLRKKCDMQRSEKTVMTKEGNGEESKRRKREREDGIERRRL